MQELAGRLTILDPQASESLRVIAYFDALVEGRVSVPALLRSAARLADCVVGFDGGAQPIRIAPGGTAATDDAQAAPAHRMLPAGSRVWLERPGPPHANDAMLLERLALAVSITLAGRAADLGTRPAIEIALDSSVSAETRAGAVAALHLDLAADLWVLALPASAIVPPSVHQTVISTPVGLVRAVLGGQPPVGSRAGIGRTGPAANLPDSWHSALLALRLSSDEVPVLNAADLGGLTLLAEVDEARVAGHPEVALLDDVCGAHPWARSTLDAFIRQASTRAAAVELGLHHSTMQARIAELTAALGWDLRTPLGRTRLQLALALHRWHHQTF